MKALKEWNHKTDPFFSKRKVLAFDFDDTLSNEWTDFPSKVISALEEFQKQGFLLILVTGRPAGWAEAFIRLMPFDAVVAENGAVIRYWKNKKLNRQKGEKALGLFWAPDSYVSEYTDLNAEFRSKAADVILKAHPKCKIASDQSFRYYDLAIDFAEEVVPPRPLVEAESIAEIFRDLGGVAKVSSIHVNGWKGSFSKGSALLYLSEKIFPFSLKDDLVYCGDSPNDGPLFELAGVSVGVSNVEEFVDVVDFDHPHYVTQLPRDEGSLELLEYIRNAI